MSGAATSSFTLTAQPPVRRRVTDLLLPALAPPPPGPVTAHTAYRSWGVGVKK
jgi:hypothetical protein